MKYRTPLSVEELASYLSMPTTTAGFVMSLFYVPPGQLPAYEAKWREWLAKTPKRLWPEWVDTWGLKRKAEGKCV